MTKLSNIVTLLPCAGVEGMNAPSNHVYLLYGEDGSVRAYNKEEALGVFGEGGFRLSSSHTLCPDCYKAVSEGRKAEFKLPYSENLLRQLIAEKVGGIRVFIDMVNKGKSACDFELLREASAEFNAGLVALIARLSQGQVVEFKNVDRKALEQMLALSRSLDWQDLNETAWTSVYSKYKEITGEALGK
jgi:hypothetical protein